MRTKYWLLSCVLLWSCGGSEKVPDGVFSKDEMVDVLLEVYVAQAKISQTRSVKRDSAEVLYKYYQNYILTKRESDTVQFYNSLTYYFEHPEDFEVINQIVLDSLNLRLEKIEAQEEKDSKDRQEERSENIAK